MYSVVKEDMRLEVHQNVKCGECSVVFILYYSVQIFFYDKCIFPSDLKLIYRERR